MKAENRAISQLQDRIENLYNEIKIIEKNIIEKIEPIINYIDEKSDYNKLLIYGLDGYRNSIIKSVRLEETFNPETWLFSIIKNNPSLRFPHHKILEYLSQQYDLDSKSFKEINYNKIVKECRIGKNKAKEYLKCLTDKGLIKERDDGYRVWYRADITL